ncbi:hypothetical protein EYF80_020333 [Liparis tanakae]|uniref:Uncharacterized protein n=1 Tax=Liparis tanakae TaxID=230148 RepID=A0A4Z2HUJ0_9TELE|nr:hypothetical protein EYF80_020333 [Liparis tanakae]
MIESYEPGETRVRRQEPLWATPGTSSAPRRSGKPGSHGEPEEAGNLKTAQRAAVVSIRSCPALPVA